MEVAYDPATGCDTAMERRERDHYLVDEVLAAFGVTDPTAIQRSAAICLSEFSCVGQVARAALGGEVRIDVLLTGRKLREGSLS